MPAEGEPSTSGSLAAASRRAVLSAGLALSAAAGVQLPTALPAKANHILSPDWEVVDLPVEKEIVLLDVGFTGTDPNHGGCGCCCCWLGSPVGASCCQFHDCVGWVGGWQAGTGAAAGHLWQSSCVPSAWCGAAGAFAPSDQRRQQQGSSD